MPPAIPDAADVELTRRKGGGSSGADALAPTKGTFSWQEVAKHNTADSPWVIVDGKVYDLTEFQHKHPGGRAMITLAAGRECTDLFNMYHIMNEEKARKYLAAYEIGALAGPGEFPAFAPDASGFYATLKRRLREHFARTGQNPRNPVPGLLRIAPVIVLALLAFTAANNPAWGLPLPLRIAAAAAFGLLQALPLLHWMHDASHGSIGGTGVWWDVIGQATFDWFAGGSISAWHHQHILGHHVYTNVYQADPDLPIKDSGDMRRLVPKQALLSLYRFQHIYLPLIYGLLSLKVRVSDVTDFLFYRTNGPLRVNWPPHVLWRAVGVKCVWLGWRVALPMLVWGLSGAACFGFFMATEVVTGYWLAYNFQVSHITEGVTWPNGDVAAAAAADGGVPSKATKKTAAAGGQKAAAAAAGAAGGPEGQQAAVLADSWAENQVRTSLDYAHHSGLWTYLCGALNYQVEHHLFPGVSQYHYPALAPMVKATCAEFGLPYLYKPDFPAAFAAHVRFLRSMGQAGKAVHMD